MNDEQNLKIFVSWSGKVSKDIAIAVKSWLESTPVRISVFMSEESLQSGVDSIATIREELSETYFGLVVLTPDNLKAEWIHFEAGALSKDIGRSRLVPLLFGLTFDQLPKTLNGFHARRFDRDSMLKLLLDINKFAPTKASEAAIKRNFSDSWPRLSRRVTKIVASVQRSTGATKKIEECPEVAEARRETEGFAARQLRRLILENEPCDLDLAAMNLEELADLARSTTGFPAHNLVDSLRQVPVVPIEAPNYSIRSALDRLRDVQSDFRQLVDQRSPLTYRPPIRTDRAIWMTKKEELVEEGDADAVRCLAREGDSIGGVLQARFNIRLEDGVLRWDPRNPNEGESL